MDHPFACEWCLDKDDVVNEETERVRVYEGHDDDDPLHLYLCEAHCAEAVERGDLVIYLDN